MLIRPKKIKPQVAQISPNSILLFKSLARLTANIPIMRKKYANKLVDLKMNGLKYS